MELRSPLVKAVGWFLIRWTQTIIGLNRNGSTARGPTLPVHTVIRVVRRPLSDLSGIVGDQRHGNTVNNDLSMLPQ